MLVVTALIIASAPLRAEVIKVDVARLEQLRGKGVPVIDLRTPEEWSRTGVIEGSHLVAFADAGGRYDIDGWTSRLAAIAVPDAPIALICWSGRRSSIASRILDRQFGYEQIFDVLGGMKQWTAEGRATVPPEFPAR
jgi:rhodanese-related sulfurtransferase